MRHVVLFLFIIFSSCVYSEDTPDTTELTSQEIKHLQQQTQILKAKINKLEKSLKDKKFNRNKNYKKYVSPRKNSKHKGVNNLSFHKSSVIVHTPEIADPESLDFYPTALVADEHIITYIAGTPVVTSPYLGSRPAFDGSDYIVNISSINRDIRLMQQRRRLYRTYEQIGYKGPNTPILALSGAVTPVATVGNASVPWRTLDIDLAGSEIDLAAILNDKVEAYMSLQYDAAPPQAGGQRIANSVVDLNMGFVNIGDLDESPLYFTGGQLYVPFGRYSSSMISAPLTLVLARTKARPFIFGYKSQKDSGPFAAVYGFKGDTTLGSTGVGGVNLGYVIDTDKVSGEIGGSFITSINDSMGMQYNGSIPNTTFGGFASIINGSEFVKKIPAAGAHGYVSYDSLSFTTEWVGATEPFRTQDLSFNGKGAQPQAFQFEAGKTFKAFAKPASFSASYQWTKDALALNLPKRRISGVFNISIWKDTVESLEYRHDINYASNQYANGAYAPGFTNANTIGPGGTANMLLAQIAVYF